MALKSIKFGSIFIIKVYLTNWANSLFANKNPKQNKEETIQITSHQVKVKRVLFLTMNL